MTPEDNGIVQGIEEEGSLIVNAGEGIEYVFYKDIYEESQ
jgi:hypothetical protein